jgi:hypothetical protein
MTTCPRCGAFGPTLVGHACLEEQAAGAVAVALEDARDRGELLAYFVIYRHPADYPEGYVVRRWTLEKRPPRLDPEEVPGQAWPVATLEAARALVPEGLARFTRAPNDDPAILETWL